MVIRMGVEREEFKMSKKMMDQTNLEQAVKMILKEIDPEPERSGLAETPKRVAKAYAELFQGSLFTNSQIAQMFNKEFELTCEDLVIEEVEGCFSHCEHHLALMYDMHITIAYIPVENKVIGLSKLVRIADMVCRRPQIQERIGTDICDILKEIGMKDIMVAISARHACVSARGAKKRSLTHTNCLRGRFKYDSALKSEVMSTIRKQRKR